MVVAVGGFLLVVVGFTCGWWWRVVLGYGGGGLCYVWWGLVEVLSLSLSLLLRFLDLEFVRGSVIVVVVCGGGCSGGSWLAVIAGTVCLYIVGF